MLFLCIVVLVFMLFMFRNVWGFILVVIWVFCVKYVDFVLVEYGLINLDKEILFVGVLIKILV